MSDDDATTAPISKTETGEQRFFFAVLEKKKKGKRNI